MPDRDGGHYFLTALAPVLAGPCRRADGSVTSPTAALREALATLPTAAQSPACVEGRRTSPFARCHRTHFARFVVIDQPAFNGRDPGNALVQAAARTDLLRHGTVDALTRAWLLLAVDFDAGDAADGGRHDYLAGLWDVMADELRDVYRHCHGFDRVRDRDGFADYIARCQVETTMPFNDYWITPPPLPSLSPRAIGAGALLLLLALGLVGIRLGWRAALVALAVAVPVAAWALYRTVLRRGGRPFPAAPGSDLRTILKALYLQQAFARFAIEQQGAEAPALHAAFAGFLAEVRPGDVHAPAQAPGAIHA